MRVAELGVPDPFKVLIRSVREEPAPLAMMAALPAEDSKPTVAGDGVPI
jgi:hypothetical protein